MYKRILVFSPMIIIVALIFSTFTPGFAEGEQPPLEDITSLYRAADINAGPNGSAPEDLVVYSGALYFGANGNDGTGRELWRYIPASGAERADDIFPGASSSYPYYLTVFGDALFFGANGNDGAGRELWKYTLADGAQRVTDIYSGVTGSDPAHLVVFNDMLYFAADGGDGAGRELWSYDQIHGAQRVADINSGAADSNPLYLAGYDGALFFCANGGGTEGVELWKYDLVSGARLVEDINNSGSSFPFHMTVYDGSLFFSAIGDVGSGNELWKYDLVNGAQFVADINPGTAGSSPSYLTVYNGALFFSATANDLTGTELWKYDRVNGADRIVDIYPGAASSYPSFIAVFLGSLYFQANGGDGFGAELWQYGNTSTAIFRSVKSLDGWVLESGETTEVGGSINASSAVISLGDDSADRQYRAVLSFNTTILPDTAVVTGAVLAIRFHSFIGTNPFTTHGNIRVDIRKGPFGSNTLEVGDFKAPASRSNIATISDTPDADNWYITKFSPISFGSINSKGLTQLRLRFATGDNDDAGTDKFRFYGGENASIYNRPLLMIMYYVP